MTVKFTIYCHTNRVNGKQYVGQTLHTMELSWQSGVKDPTADRNGSAGMTPEARSERIRKGWAKKTPEARAEQGRILAEGRRKAKERRGRIDAKLVPFILHWHKRGHSIESIAQAFEVSNAEIERLVA